MILAWAARRLAEKVVTGNLTGKEVAAAALLAAAVEASRSCLATDLLQSVDGKGLRTRLDGGRLE